MNVRKYMPGLVIAAVGAALFYFVGQAKGVNFSFAYTASAFAYVFVATTYRQVGQGRQSQS